MAVLGTQLPARAAVPEAVPAESAAPAKAHVALEPSCSTPKKGEAGCFALRRTDIASVKSLASPSLVPNGYGAADLQSAYSLPADGGAGQTVAIVDAYDDPTAEADLATYRAQYGLPACTTANGCFSKVDQRGGTGYPAADTGWAGEISLDLDMVSAAAPYARILLVESDAPSFDDLGAAVDQAVALGAKYVSNSYGTSYDSSPGSGEDPADTTYDAHYNHPGVAIVASSGDSDYGVAFPAASPYVTSVGGTSLVHDSGSTRGWSESVWNNNGYGPGSGCSLYEPKPAFQTDTGCGMRTVADVSAVADPATGVAVYQTYGGGGWTVYGGTSAASPIIAGVYAAAGTPVAGTYPNSYPYATAGAGLNDVTTGNNGTCTPAYLCTAGAGYDGPTGLGTPDGLAAFRSGPHGELSGTITDSATGSPVSGATVTVTGGGTTHTNADGAYTLTLPAGTYDITVDAFGYATGSATGVAIADGDTLTRSFALAPVPSQTVSGKVTDGSGHDWPLYAKITVDGVPGGPVWTDPLTGAYSMELPQGHDYTLHVDSAYPGYESRTRTITVGDAALKVNLLVAADPWQATAAGYALKLTGPTEPFDSTSSAPQDWSVVNADGTTGGWTFDDPGSRGNNTGGDGAFAIADSDHYGSGTHQDSQLISPVYDFTGNSSPELAFATDLRGYSGQTAEVDVTTDGGGTWTSAWSSTTTVSGPTKIEVPLTDYAGKAAVQLRFHFTSAFGWWWKLDNVFVGRRDYTPTPGGLVTGMVTDANTSAGLVGATVTNKDQATQSAVTLATPDDPGLGDGFYSLFSSSPGDNGFTAAKPHYTGLDKTVKVVADSAVGANFALDAGQLTMSKTSVDASVGWGGQTTKTVTVKNIGKAAATVKLSEQAGGFTIKSSGGAPLKLVKGDYSPLSSKAGAPGAGSTAKVVPGAAGDAWQTAADLPTALMDNAVAGYDGKVYSAFGYNGSADSKDLYVLDPVAGTWTKLAGAADTREDPAHGFIDGKFYAVGGWGSDTAPDPKLEIYDPGSNSWTTGAPAPKPYAGAGSAVLDGKLYTVGGCGANSCGSTDVSVYDPATDSWAQLAAYPEQIAWSACAGIDGKLYCGGGVTDSGEVKHAYVYDPGTDSWSPIADMPVSVWGSSYTSANGLLLTSSGVSQNSITNQGFAFDPAAGEWTALPNANTGTYRGGGSIGFFKVGGANAPHAPSTKVELLPGYDQGGTADVSWLSESTQQLTVQPGKSSTVTLTLDASVPEVTQPGDFSAQLAFSSDTPYSVPKIPVTLHVAEPSTWGKITGTVLGVTTAGGTAPIAGATVQIDTWATSYTLTTGTDGGYALWLDVRNNPLTVIAAKDGFQPTVATVTIKKKTTVTKNFTLKRK